MKTAKAEDLRSKSEDELKKMLLDTKKEQFNLRFQQTSGQLERVSEIRKTRRTVARIKTLLKEKESQSPGKSESRKKKNSDNPKFRDSEIPKTTNKVRS